MGFVVVIPARYASERLPGKPLIDLAGKAMILRVCEQAAKSEADEVIVATDDERIVEAVEQAGFNVVMTRADHPSGTDRLQEVCEVRGFPPSQVVVNVQGDEPLIPPLVINQVAANLESAGTDMATLSEPVDSVDDLTDPDIVKVVTDEAGRALYFSRAPIPWPRDSFSGDDKVLPESLVPQRHLGIYAYRVSLLNDFVTWPACPLELTEKLEQLRAMWHGRKIHVAESVASVPPGIDNPQDVARTLAVLES